MRHKYLGYLAIALVLLFIAAISDVFLYAQEPDPFYLDLFKNGEEAFLAKDYSEAAKKLEIAAFGLHRQKELMEKAYAYLAISHYHLNDMVKSEKYVKDTRDLLGDEGFDGLEIDESAWPDMEMLVSRFNMGKIAKRERKLLEEGTAEELEVAIRKDRHNTALYIALYERHAQRGDLDAGRSVLKDLIKQDPSQSEGYFLLGKVDYMARKYKDAAKNFEKVIDAASSAQATEKQVLEAKAYLILCASRRGDEKKAQRLFSASAGALTEEEIQSLSAEEDDQSILLEILAANRRESERRSELLHKKKLEENIKTEPWNVSLYYELYGLHRKSNDSRAAKKVIQDLVKKNPGEMEGYMLLGKIEFSQRRFKEALRAFSSIMEASSEADVNRELSLKSTIYAIICLSRLNRSSEVGTYLDFLRMSSDEEEIKRLVDEEGLENEWSEIR